MVTLTFLAPTSTSSLIAPPTLAPSPQESLHSQPPRHLHRRHCQRCLHYLIIFTQVLSIGLPIQDLLPSTLILEARISPAMAHDKIHPSDANLHVDGASAPLDWLRLGWWLNNLIGPPLGH